MYEDTISVKIVKTKIYLIIAIFHVYSHILR